VENDATGIVALVDCAPAQSGCTEFSSNHRRATEELEEW